MADIWPISDIDIRSGQPSFERVHCFSGERCFQSTHWLFDVCGRWSQFHGDLSHYKRKLEEALVVHALIRELEEVRDRANEKVSDGADGFYCCRRRVLRLLVLPDAPAAESPLRLRRGQCGKPDQTTRGNRAGGRDHPGEVKGQSLNV